eukprot:11519960-Alexandrium_andersonii.AAC.1
MLVKRDPFPTSLKPQEGGPVDVDGDFLDAMQKAEVERQKSSARTEDLKAKVAALKAAAEEKAQRKADEQKKANEQKKAAEQALKAQRAEEEQLAAELEALLEQQEAE